VFIKALEVDEKIKALGNTPEMQEFYKGGNISGKTWNEYQRLSREYRQLMDSVAGAKPTGKGVIIKETRPRAGRQDVIRVRADAKKPGLVTSMDTIDAPSTLPRGLDESEWESLLNAPENTTGRLSPQQSSTDLQPTLPSRQSGDPQSIAIRQQKTNRMLQGNQDTELSSASTVQAKNLKDKTTKRNFMDTTSKYLGAEKAGEINAVNVARQYNDSFKDLTPAEKLEAILISDGMKETGSPRAVEAAAELRKIYDTAYGYFTQDKGIKMGYRHEYSPRIYKTPEGEMVNAAEYKLLQTGSGRTKQRQADQLDVDSLVTKDPAELIQKYYNSLERAASGRKYLNDLESQGLIVRATDPPKGLRPVIAEGLQPGDGQIYYANKDVADRLNHLFGDRQPSNIIEKGIQKLADLNNLTQTIVLSGGIPRTSINAFGFMQAMKEFMAGHPVQAGKALNIATRAKVGDNFFNSKSGVMKIMAENGIDPRYDLKPEFQSLVKQIQTAEGGKAKTSVTFHGLVDEPTFGRMMPALTTMHFEGIYNGLLKKGMSQADAGRIAADATRNWYGMNTLAKSATRAQVVDDAAGAALFAPKFRESMVNFWFKNAQALDPRGGFKNARSLEYRDNVKFMLAAAAMYAAMDGINYALNGTHMYQNPDGKKDKLLIPTGQQAPTGGKEYVGVPFLPSIATVPRNAAMLAYNAATMNLEEAGKNFKSFLSIPFKTAGDLITNEGYFPGPIVDKDQPAAVRAAQGGSYVVKNTMMQPWIREGLNAAGQTLPDDAKKYLDVRKQTPYQTASQAMELPFRFYDSQYFKNSPEQFAGGQYTKTQSSPTDSKDIINAAFGTPEAKKFLRLSDADKKATNPELYTQYKAMQTGLRTDMDLPDNLDPAASQVLNRFNRLTNEGERKVLIRERDAEFKKQAADFMRKDAAGELSTADKLNAQGKLRKGAVGQAFSKDIRDLYDVSLETLMEYLDSDPNGKTLYDELLAYDRALVTAGLRKTSKFNKYGVSYSSGKSSKAKSVKISGSTSGSSIVSRSGTRSTRSKPAIRSVARTVKIKK
jgi:hypothetical protein